MYDGDTYNSIKLVSVSGDILLKFLVVKFGRVSFERLNYCNFNDRIIKLVKLSYIIMLNLIGVFFFFLRKMLCGKKKFIVYKIYEVKI